MAVGYQNLFSLDSEDFDDEEFLSVLEDSESTTSAPGTSSNLRFLRPISHNTGVAAVEFRGGSLQPAPVSVPTVPSFAQDVDDEELLSMCSELEEVTARYDQDSGSRSNSDVHAGLSSSSSPNVSTTKHLRPTVNAPLQGPGPCFQALPQPSDSNRFCNLSSSPVVLQDCSGIGGSTHSLSSKPTAKRPCLRSITEASPRAPAAMHPPPQLRFGHSATHFNPKVQTASTLQNMNVLAWQNASPVKHVLGTPQMSRSNFSSPCLISPNTHQTPVVTNHLVQLVTAANKTPRRLSWDTASPKERRFPGPAGLLPQQVSGSMLEEIMVSTPHTPNHGARSKLCTKEVGTSQQSVEEDFVKGPWATMKAELSLDENDPNCFLRTYSVIMVLRKAALKQLQKSKVPNMAVALKSLNPANGDASAVFRDPTGEIQGTIHHLLLEERESELKAGSVLLLKQVGVFSPSRRNHYLNVTPSNIVKIYPPGENTSTRLPIPAASDAKEDLNANHTPTPPLPQCSSSSTEKKAHQISNPIDWDTDDLDALFWDMSEDTGD
uniref:Homologous recombination factor with OB-fold n=1 Tax=Leptobrachium leishanense TaxID=445787 RepID=A0A8C5QWQ9_9ANUR